MLFTIFNARDLNQRKSLRLLNSSVQFGAFDSVAACSNILPVISYISFILCCHYTRHNLSQAENEEGHVTALRTQLNGKKAELEEYVRGSVRELVAQGCKLDEVGREWLLMCFQFSRLLFRSSLEKCKANLQIFLCSLILLMYLHKSST